MMISYAAILLAGLTPLVCAGIAKAGAKGYDNHNPREWMAQQTGFRARANAAQANCFEAFPLFATGMLLALYSEVPQEQIDVYAGVFIAARIAYIAFYLSDKDRFRSLAWLVGVICTVGLFVASLGN